MKAYKYKLYKDDDFKHLHKILNISGSLYNHCIDLQRRYYRDYGKQIHKYTLSKHLTKWTHRQYTYWKEIPAEVRGTITDKIEQSYTLFFNNIKKGKKASPPSFQKVREYTTATFRKAGHKIIDNKTILIWKRKYRVFDDLSLVEGTIKQMHLTRNSLGEFFVVFVTDHIDEKLKGDTHRTEVGMDFGLKTFLTLSDGTEIKSPEYHKNALKELKKASKEHSAKVKGSNNRKRANEKLTKIHKKVANQRKFFFYNLAKELCLKYKTIAIEDLNLSGMTKLWGRKVNDLAWGMFTEILKYQASKYDTEIIMVDRFYPSSKTCNCCGKVNKDLKLTDRTWTCECGEVLDRDLNASINILQEALRKVS